MAWLKKIIDKPTFIMIFGIWTAVSLYVTQAISNNLPLTTAIVTIGNLVIAWIGIESQSDHNAEKS